MRPALLLLTCALAAAARADEPDDAPAELLALRAGCVITVTGEELRPGTVVLRGGAIEAVGARVDLPPTARVVDLGDRTLMPGLVLARTRLGLPGYSRGGNNAHRSVLPELLPDPGRFEPALRAGFTVLGVIPAGSGIPGQAVAVRPLDGVAAVVSGGGYLRVRFVDLPDDPRTLREAFAGAKAAIDKEAAARAEWEKTQGAAPVASRTPFVAPPVPESLRPFVALLRKTTGDAPRLLIEVGSAGSWVHLEEGFAKHGLLDRLLLQNQVSSDLDRVLPRVAARKGLALCWPRVSYEAHTRTRRNLPAELAAAGARVAFVPLSDSPDGVAELLEGAAHVHREGLPRDHALRALTLHPAEALGLEKVVGALEPGRKGDLLVLDGDPLEAGARPVAVLIEGRPAWIAEGEEAAWPGD